MVQPHCTAAAAVGASGDAVYGSAVAGGFSELEILRESNRELKEDNLALLKYTKSDETKG